MHSWTVEGCALHEVKSGFRRFAVNAAVALGSPFAFVVAVLLVLAWAITGPYFQYSEAWQLVINTGTTIATFLLVFVLQNTQIRETKALTVKLDELLRAVDGARTSLVNVEDLPDEEIDRLCSELKRLGRIAESGTGRARLSISSRLPESR
jgi:low affinity Fe/Cu permease